MTMPERCELIMALTLGLTYSTCMKG